jgi:hypothetical protein
MNLTEISFLLLTGMESSETMNIDIITNTITNTILDAANKTIPNRYLTVKKDNPPWITTKIKKYIRRKNPIHKKAKKTNNGKNFGKFVINVINLY